MTFITADDVRRASGAPSSLISDAFINEAITIVESEMKRWMNTAFVPTQRIDHLNGNSLQRLFTMKNPLLSVRALTINDSTSITPSTLDWSKSSGKVTLSNSSEGSVFTTGNNNTFIKYLYGLLEDSSTETTTTAAAIVGTSVALSVASITGFADEDWVEIYGMDGSKEVAQINDTPVGTTIQVDQLVKAHESGSTIIKLQIPYYIKRFMEIEATIYVAVYAIGGTYTFNTSYSLGELSVNKGEPYPQWREVIQRMINERKMRRATIRIRPSILVD
jgi:hypothetical protein